jgi:hypothetical protein
MWLIVSLRLSRLLLEVLRSILLVGSIVLLYRLRAIRSRLLLLLPLAGLPILRVSARIALRLVILAQSAAI